MFPPANPRKIRLIAVPAALAILVMLLALGCTQSEPEPVATPATKAASLATQNVMPNTPVPTPTTKQWEPTTPTPSPTPGQTVSPTDQGETPSTQFPAPRFGSEPKLAAQLLPDDTQVYFSLSLQPGDDQQQKFEEILERFRGNPDFQSRLDELMDEAEAETGINFRDDVLPWLGPEIAIGVMDVPGSVIGMQMGGSPQVVVFTGTRDPEASLETLHKLIQSIEREEFLTFEADTYREFTVFSEETSFQHYTVTWNYLVFATDRDLLEDTIDRIVDGESSYTLFSSARFQEAVATLPQPRFSTFYVDTGAIWTDVRRQFGGEIPPEVREQINLLVPDWVAVTGAFLDKGLKVVGSAPQVEGQLRPITPRNSLASLELMPDDTLALISFAADPDLDPFREQLAEGSFADLGPDLYGVLAYEFGLDIQADSSMVDVFDALLFKVEENTGIDLEEDVLAWMTGEVSLALLPLDFQALEANPMEEPVEALVLIQFDQEQGQKLVSTMHKIAQILQDRFGLQAEAVSYDGWEGEVFDVRELVGGAAYQPGYLILEDHLIIGTTTDSLILTASLQAGQGDSLAMETEYNRLLNETSGLRNPVFYADLRQFMEAMVASLDPYDLQESQMEGAPFLEPLMALMLVNETLAQDGIDRFSMILTID